MGTSMTGVAGQAAGGTAGQAADAAWQGNILGATFEGDGSSPEPRPANAECVPLDPAGAKQDGTSWATSEPGDGRGCASGVLGSPLDIAAVHIVNTPGIVREWMALVPTAPGAACLTPLPEAFLYTADVTEQLTVFDAPIHADAGQWLSFGFDLFNPTNQLLSGTTAIWSLPNVPPSLVPCALHGAVVGLEGSQDLDPGQESMICTRLTLAEPHEVFLVRVSNAPNLLDSVLSFGQPTGPDGTTACDDLSDAMTPLAIVKGAATVEAKPRGAHMLAGQQVVLRVHAVNVTDRRITGEASARIF